MNLYKRYKVHIVHRQETLTKTLSAKNSKDDLFSL